MIESDSINKLKVILFDMDGVIVNSMPYHAKAWIKALSDHNIMVDKIDVLKREGVPGVETIRQVFKERNLPAPSMDLITEIYDKKHDYFESHNVKIFPEITHTLKTFLDSGIKIGLVTGSTRHSMERTLPVELMNLFEVIVCGDEVEHGKPHPEPFLTAFEHFDSFKKDEVLVIENAPMGIKSASAAGFCCFAIETSLPEEFLSMADRIFKSHEELLLHCKENLL